MARDLVKKTVFITREQDEKFQEIKESTEIPFSIFMRKLLQDELDTWTFD